VPLDFTAIDFETANSSMASACSVGLVKVRVGQVVDRIGWFIRPPLGHDHFIDWNTRIHGITAEMVMDAPSWLDQMADLLAFTGDDHLVAHNAGFDMGVIKAACAATGLAVPSYSYFCSLQIARNTYTLDSYKLPSGSRRSWWWSSRSSARSPPCSTRCRCLAAGSTPLGGRTSRPQSSSLPVPWPSWSNRPLTFPSPSCFSSMS
jgi:hypothetical protein